MIYLNDIVSIINDTLKDRLKAYPGASFNNISYQSVVNSSGATIIYPTSIDFNAKSGSLSINEKNPFKIYHRITSGAVTYASNQSYGDGDTISATTSVEISAVVIGYRRKINVSPEQFALIILDAFPALISASGQSSAVKILPSAINFDPRSVFSSEFSGITYFIGPEMFLFSIRYRIEGNYMKGCYQNCEC